MMNLYQQSTSLRNTHGTMQGGQYPSFHNMIDNSMSTLSQQIENPSKVHTGPMIATTHLNQSQATSELIQDSSMFQMERESKDATRYIEGEPKKSVSRRLRKKYKRLKHESSNVILNM